MLVSTKKFGLLEFSDTFKLNRNAIVMFKFELEEHYIERTTPTTRVSTPNELPAIRFWVECSNKTFTTINDFHAVQNEYLVRCDLCKRDLLVDRYLLSYHKLASRR
jgi:hypothetical protein